MSKFIYMPISNTFCEHCGNLLKESSVFCPTCGKKIAHAASAAQEGQNEIFYSTDWTQARTLALASLPHFDVMADQDNLYIIELPKSNNSLWGLLIGLVLFNILGAILGSIIGSSYDTKNRDRARNSWLNQKKEIISRSYEKSIAFKIPLSTLKNTIEYQERKFIFTQGDKKIVFKKNKEELLRLKKYLDSYVL